MDTTFITIHDLTDDARILYSSDSIVDILGHTPDEVVNRSVWQFFHPDELPIAKAQHSRGVRLDKAAVLSYCRLKNRQGDWVGCECCFSIVYDVMVCCTSIYRHGMQSQKRAVEAPLVRKLFSSSPKDPRYHMLSHLSSKFDLGPERQTHEPRAALFLNRFTRTLTVMYATSGIEQIIGISGEEMKGKSFYFCIANNCLSDAVRCLESAKGNDSIAYMRFFFRDPRTHVPDGSASSESEDDIMTDITSSDDDSDSAVDANQPSTSNGTSSNSRSLSRPSQGHRYSEEQQTGQRGESGDDVHRTMFGDIASNGSSASSNADSPRSNFREEPIELEAVVSCTSDGLVVCLRRARPLLPGTLPVSQPAQPQYNGIFAAPWATQPIFHPAPPQYPPYPLGAQHPLMMQQQAAPSMQFQNAFMQTIRDVAVFAWALTGINGSLADYARGTPQGESQPPEGLPIWNPLPVPEQFGKTSATPSDYASGPGSNSSSSNDPFGFGDPGLR